MFATFKQWKAMIEKQTGKKVKRLKTDNGMKFCSIEFDQFCKNKGIVWHRTVRYTPQQNGVAERMTGHCWRELGVCSLMPVCQNAFGPRQ